jgi:hypothetical protein
MMMVSRSLRANSEVVKSLLPCNKE